MINLGVIDLHENIHKMLDHKKVPGSGLSHWGLKSFLVLHLPETETSDNFCMERHIGH